MESILNSTKQILGIQEDYTEFDLDVITHINAAFSSLDQLGVGPEGGFFIGSADSVWDEFVVPANQLNMVKSYVYLRVKSMFDPPATSYHTAAMQKQIEEFEWRLNTFREELIPVPVPPEEVDE